MITMSVLRLEKRTTPILEQPAETLKLDKLMILYQPVSTNWDFNSHLWLKTG